MKKLTDIEKGQMVEMRKNRYKLREIGEKFNVSKQRVYQILLDRSK